MMRDSTLRGHQVSNEFDEERLDRGEPPIVFDDDADGADATDAAAATKRSETQADILIGLATSAALFHTPAPDRDGYAEIVIDGRRETYRVHSKPFRDWLRFQYYKKTKRGCNSDAMKVAVETLAAKAAFECPEHPVFIRLAEHEGAIYIDIGDDHRNVVGSRHRVGRSPTKRQCGSCDRRAPGHCRFPSPAKAASCC